MAGGIAYTGLSSIFAALAIGVTVIMAALGDRPALRQAVITQIDAALPGVLDTGDGGMVTIDQLILDSPLTLGSVIAGAVLVYSAMSLMGAIKTALRAMFGMVNLPPSAVVGQAVNLVGFVVILLGVLITAMATLVTTVVAGEVGAALGVPVELTGRGAWVAGLIVSFLIDAAVLGLIITVCGIRPPFRDLAAGCALGAVAFGALRQAGAGAVGSAVDNPLLASAATLVVLVVWLHLASRVLLLVAAWTANPPMPRPVVHPAEVHGRERPNYVTLTVPATLAWPRQSITGSLEADPTEHPDYVAPVPLKAAPEEPSPPAPSRPGWLRLPDPPRWLARLLRRPPSGQADSP